MRWKLGGGVAAIAMLGAVTGSATDSRVAQRAAWRETYTVPATIPFPAENPYTPAKAELGLPPLLRSDPVG